MLPPGSPVVLELHAGGVANALLPKTKGTVYSVHCRAGGFAARPHWHSDNVGTAAFSEVP